MKTATLCLALCLLALSVHTKILVYNDLPELRQLSLPSCESFATTRFSDVKTHLYKKGIYEHNGAGRIKFGGKFEFVKGVLCKGDNGSRVPGWASSTTSSYFSEHRVHKKCSNYEQYTWEYLIKAEDRGKCECKPKGYDSNGGDLYAVIYADQYTREVIPGYMTKHMFRMVYSDKDGREKIKDEGFYFVC